MGGAQLPLCRIDELPDDGARGFDPLGEGRDALFIVRRGGTLRAYRNACPHWPGTPMAWRKDGYLSPDGLHIVCYAHGARFDIDTGGCVLLDGRTATTHWEDIPALRAAFPAVHVVEDVPFVDEGRIVTSAGISAGIGMSLHLVGRILGPGLARGTARQMQYDWEPGAGAAP